MSSTLRVLAYHKIDRRPELGVNTISPHRFAAQLALCRASGFVGVSLDELRRVLVSEACAPERALHLTFDDGYADLSDGAWEAARAVGFPATVFPVSGFVGARSTWDRTFPRRLHLSWNALRGLVASGVTVGAHSVTHPFLTRLGPARALHEMLDSRRALEDRLGVRVSALAYPYGDWSPDVARLAEDAGFDIAFTLDPRRAFTPGNRLSLPRVAIYGLDTLRALRAKLGLRGEAAWRRQCTKNRWINRCAYASQLLPS